MRPPYCFEGVFRGLHRDRHRSRCLASRPQWRGRELQEVRGEAKDPLCLRMVLRRSVEMWAVLTVVMVWYGNDALFFASIAVMPT
jgi:hypothetical protein